MKFHGLRKLFACAGVACLAGVAVAQNYGSASLLPAPRSDYRYPLPQQAAYPQADQRFAAAGGAAGYGYSGYEEGGVPAAPSPSDAGDYYGGTVQGGEMVYDGGAAPGGCGCQGQDLGGDYYGAMNGPWGCGSCGASCGAPAPRWFASAAGLIMTRDTSNAYYFSYFDQNEAAQLLDYRDTVNWGGGVEARVGAWFACGAVGMEFVYWGIYAGQGETNLQAGQNPGFLNAILNFDQLTYNGAPANLVTDAAQRHRLTGNYEVHNAEANLLIASYYGPQGYGGGTPLVINWIAGFRYFRFSEHLQFAADSANTTFTGDVNELYYDVDVENNLYGFQLGADGNLYFTRALSLDLGTRFGIFGNFIDHRSVIAGSAGTATINNGPFNGQAFDISSDTETVSFLGELKAGLNYRLTRYWSVFGGYRAVGVSNVALTTNQIPSDLRGINDVRAVDTNGSLILHGAYAGLELNW